MEREQGPRWLVILPPPQVEMVPRPRSRYLPEPPEDESRLQTHHGPGLVVQGLAIS